MRILILVFIIIFQQGKLMAQTLYDFTIQDVDGKVINLKDFEGKPVLLVNTASRCGFTKQYTNLANLYQEYLEKDLIIIGTPSNSFNQELASEEEVKEFCLVNYNTKFILTEIIDVKGPNVHPIYGWLKENYSQTPKWNFYKYLFNGKGELVDSWSSITSPDSKKITKKIDQLI